MNANNTAYLLTVNSLIKIVINSFCVLFFPATAPRGYLLTMTEAMTEQTVVTILSRDQLSRIFHVSGIARPMDNLNAIFVSTRKPDEKRGFDWFRLGSISCAVSAYNE